MHVCGTVPWRLISAIRPHLLSFDARHPAHRGFLLDDMVRRLWWLGVRAAPGVIPVNGSPGTSDPLTPFELRGLPSVMVSPACGTGIRTPDEERVIAEQLRDFAAAARMPGGLSTSAWRSPEAGAGRV
jgi:hypothetical protein